MRLVALSICLLITAFVVPSQAADATPEPEAVVSKAQVLEEKAADKDGATPAVPKSEIITQSEAQAVDPEGAASVDDAIVCLSRTLYWEAKGGTDADMAAVANVVLNRLGHEGFPDTICGVVKQGSEEKSLSVFLVVRWTFRSGKGGRTVRRLQGNRAQGPLTSNWQTAPTAPCISTTATSNPPGPASTSRLPKPGSFCSTNRGREAEVAAEIAGQCLFYAS